MFAATPPRWALTSSIEVQSRGESRTRGVASQAFNDRNLGRLVERFGLYSYPDGAKARQVVENLTTLIIEANLRGAQTDGGRALERYRVTGPPRQAPDGPSATMLTALGLGAGLLAGLALAAWRRRAR